MSFPYTLPLAQLGMKDLPEVGGKNASLGEMIHHLAGAGVQVPGGFATTASAFREFLQQSGLAQWIDQCLRNLNVDDVVNLAKIGAQIREKIINTPLHPPLESAVRQAYRALAQENGDLSLAVRSSATAEDLPDASFAGQQETFLNIRGEDNVLEAIHHVFASLYNDRAIAYRVHKGFSHSEVALSAGVQKMVRSDLASAGVMFTVDTESGFNEVVFITASYGLGESVVQGAVNPDEYYVHKPTLAQGFRPLIRKELGAKQTKMVFADTATAGKSVKTLQTPSAERALFCLSEEEVLGLARYAVLIEKHYGRPMDIEWGKDGEDGKLYILQARPETVQSQTSAMKTEHYELLQHSKVLAKGRAIGSKIGIGPVRVIHSSKEMERVQKGDVLVTDMTDPNWEPVMKRASAIVTNRGGRTCHAAIIARELGIPAVVGCGDATEMLHEREEVTVSCAEGDTGRIYRGKLNFQIVTKTEETLPTINTKIMMNVGNPELAFNFQKTPNAGVGLARLEFVINNVIGVHPKAAINIHQVTESVREEVLRRAQGYANPIEFFVEKLTEGVATLAASFYPKPVIVRLSDFKSNEYRKLIGGAQFEPEEENPMLGFRGAARYIDPNFADCFALECRAMHRVRSDMGLTNVEIMVPFVRTVNEARQVVELLAKHGLKRGEQGLRLIMMCEVPSNAILAKQFLQYFDGFSIGSNDLTQLTLGLDRDSGLVAGSFDERDPAVQSLLEAAIRACREENKYVGICGQGPSDHPDLALWLMERGISSISLNPDTVLDTWRMLGK